MQNFNLGRSTAFDAFCQTLDELRGRPNVTEVNFRDRWLNKLQMIPTLFASGWYEPPPFGMSVLFASTEKPERMSYESLRQEVNWPSQITADWKGYLFAYCSCVSRETGLPCDFDFTLYFGDNKKHKEHYQNCFNATARLLRGIQPSDTSRSIVAKAEKIFAEENLKNCIVNSTHVTSSDIGMTFPVLPREVLALSPRELTQHHKNTIRLARKFINNVADWPLEDGMQFTIEPQLQSTVDPSLPQISFHYLLQKKNNQIQVCHDIDELIGALS
jgi:hypothetical protein